MLNTVFWVIAPLHRPSASTQQLLWPRDVMLKSYCMAHVFALQNWIDLSDWTKKKKHSHFQCANIRSLCGSIHRKHPLFYSSTSSCPKFVSLFRAQHGKAFNRGRCMCVSVCVREREREEKRRRRERGGRRERRRGRGEERERGERRRGEKERERENLNLKERDRVTWERRVQPVRNRRNRGLFANTYEHHHFICHPNLFPSRAWTDCKTKEIINCLYFNCES